MRKISTQVSVILLPSIPSLPWGVLALVMENISCVLEPNQGPEATNPSLFHEMLHLADFEALPANSFPAESWPASPCYTITSWRSSRNQNVQQSNIASPVAAGPLSLSHQTSLLTPWRHPGGYLLLGCHRLQPKMQRETVTSLTTLWEGADMPPYLQLLLTG